MTIGHKLALAISLTALLVAGVAGYSIHLARRALRASIEANAERVASEAIAEIERVLHDREQGWRLLARSPEFQKALVASNEETERRPQLRSWIDAADREWRSADPLHPPSLARRISEAPLSKLLRAETDALERQEGYRVYGEVFVTNRFGINVGQTGMTTDFRQDDERWWQRAREQGIFIGDISWDESARSLSTELCIRVDDDQGRFLGVLKAVLDIGFARRTLADREGAAESGWTLRLAGRSGGVIDDPPDGSGAPIKVTLPGCLDRIAASASSGGFVCGGGGDGRVPVFTAWARMGGLGWLVLRQSPVERAFAPIERVTRELIVGAGAALGIAVLLGLGLFRNVSRRIGNLRDAMGQVERGQLEARVTLRGRDEIRDLGESFNAMAGELKRAVEEARAADLARQRFIAHLSHEIRAPLSVAMGHAELILDPAAGSAERLEHARTIRRSTRQLIALVDNVIDLSSLESNRLTIERKCFSPCAVIGEVVEVMCGIAERKGLALEARLHGPLPARIESDPLRLRQILVNLIDNAIKFTRRGGVTVSAQLEEEKGRPSLLRVEVSDTGIGIEPDHLDRLFRPVDLAQASRSDSGGEGLGLAISVLLADLLGGGIRVSSVPGRGSIFRVTVATGSLEGVERLESPEDLARSLHANRCQPATLGRLGGRVLVVEDDPLCQKLIQTFLEKAGLEVGVASDGAEGLERARSGTPSGRPWDLLLMDLKMPSMDGWTAARKLRESGYAGPLVALTAETLAGVRERCLEAGYDDHLRKPFSCAELIEAVRRQLR
ncbi:MAG: response regulator [Myxococcota bacterium]